MNDHLFPTSVSLPAIWALEDYIRHDDPRFVVLDVIKYPHPRLKVRDAVYGIVVAFSSEAEYRAYCRMTAEQEA